MTDEDDDNLVKLIFSQIHTNKNNQCPGMDPVSKISEFVFQELLRHIAAFQKQKTEFAIALSSSGAILERGFGSADRVALGRHPGGIAAHNHPKSWPPNWNDIEKMLDDNLAFMTVATNCGTLYHLAPLTASLATVKVHFERIFGIATIIAMSFRQRFFPAMTDEELHCRQMHAVFSVLAIRDLLCYSRMEWQSTLNILKTPTLNDS